MASSPSNLFRLSSTQTALALIAPLHLQPEINSIRKIHDKAFKKWEPHINILYPFVDPSRLTDAVVSLRKCLQDEKVENIQVRLDGVGTFTHRRNATVFLKPNPESEARLCRLRGILLRALGCNEGDGTHDGTFRPHLTMGQAGFQGMGIEKLVAAVEKATGGKWEAKKLAVLRREITGEMKVVEELSLQDNGEEKSDSDESHPSGAGWRKCCHFAQESGWNPWPWSKAFSSDNKTMPFDVTVSSYNLMVDPYAPPFPSRLPYIMAAISEALKLSPHSLQVLCLQEVSDEMLPLLLGDPFLQKYYPFSTHHSSSLILSDRNLVTFSSEPFSFFTVEFPERHKSSLVISLQDFPVEVANVHLTSGLTDKSIITKKAQMDILTRFFDISSVSKDKNIVIAGDFNITSSSDTIETALSQGIITQETARSIQYMIDSDLWEDAFYVLKDNENEVDNDELHEGEEGATFDRLNNPLAAMSISPIDNRPQRYDKVLFQKGAQIHPLLFEIFGRPSKDGQCGSDHYGVCATFRFSTHQDTPAISRTDTSKLETAHEHDGVVDDSKGLQELLEPFLPSAADRRQREEALELLQQALTGDKDSESLILAPLGSYCMDTYFPDSDVDVLAIGSVIPSVFFGFATTQLRKMHSDKEGSDDGFKGVNFVNSLVSIIDVYVLGVKFDLQYCQAPELVQRYYSASPHPDLKNLVFDTTLISTLSPSSLRPLNTYRDTVYLLNTMPHLESYRTAHRFLSLYLKSRGLYSAKFGYLGGIHLSLMLNRVVKLLASKQSNSSQPSPATIVRGFFTYYAAFKWASDIVVDPSLPAPSKPITRSPRDAVFIHAIHVPTARPNVASSCTRLSAQVLTDDFDLAAEKLEEGNDWKWCLRTSTECVSDFTNGFGAFVRITVDAWDLDEDPEVSNVRDIIGILESRMVRLMITLGRINSLRGRVWPARFCAREDRGRPKENQLKGYYLVGVTALDKESHDEMKRLFTGKVVAAMREFEEAIREVESENVLVGMDVVPKKKILEMDLVIDDRVWS